MNFNVNFVMVIAAFFVGLCLAGGIAIVVYYFLSMRERKNFHRNMEKSTDFILAKLGLEIANVEHNAEQVKTQTMTAAQAKEAERLRAMLNCQNAEIVRLQALNAELQAERGKEDVLDQRARNTQKEIDIRKTLIDAGVDPNRVPPPPKKGIMGWIERNQFLFIFILGLIFIAVFALLHIKGMI